MGLLGLVVVLIIGAIIYAVSRASIGGTPSAPGGRVRESPPTIDGSVPRRPLEEDLSRWVHAGLVSEAQSRAILDHEHALAADAVESPIPAGVPSRARRFPIVAEALGYLGGTLAVIGLALAVAQSWPDLPTAAQLLISAVAALGLLGGGALVQEQADPALARLRWSLWLASTAATALFAGTVAVAAGAGRNTVVMACAAAGAVEGGLLWRGRDRPVQQLTLLAGVAVFIGALVAAFAPAGVVGVAVWLVGAVFLFAGLRRLTPTPLLTEGVGAVTVVVGAGITTASWPGFGLVLLVATGVALLVLAAVPGLAPTRADQILVGAVGGVTLLQAIPSTLGYFAGEAGIVTGLTTWLVGCVLVFVGARRLVRLPVMAEALGAAALIGGAALTGTQAPGFAAMFGVVTAIGLVALGMLPGQVLLSLFGSVGLLINVPWAIAWFFPGEGRVPLLILTSGALILGVAVLLARLGGRFRQDLGRIGRGGPPSNIVPGGSR